MLCNLEEVQTNLHSLLQELSEIHHRLVNPIQAKKSNKHTLLLKLPKIILMVRVCPFLQYQDLIQLSTTCIGLRKCLFSPIGWKVVLRGLTPYPVVVRQMGSAEPMRGRSSSPLQDSFPIHMIEDEKYLKKARAECKKSLMQVHDKFKYKEEEHNQLVRQLKSEKTHLNRLKMYREYLEQKKAALEITNNQYRTQLRLTNQGFEDRVKALDAQNEELFRQTTKLQNQKEALVGKIREYQNEIETIKVDSEKSKQILKKIKNYLLYKEL